MRRTRKIQVPYLNTFQRLWEYKESFLAGQIDLNSPIDPACPLCGRLHCYRKVAPYWRYAVELFPEFRKERIPVARFLCRQRQRTFSLLPVQLIPYFQYTVGAVMGTLLLGWGYWQRGQGGFWPASVEVDPDSLVTPWLVAFWLAAVLRGLRRGHAVLGRFYDLTGIGTPKRVAPWEEAAGYFRALGMKAESLGQPLWMQLVRRYSQATHQGFLLNSGFKTAPEPRGGIPDGPSHSPEACGVLLDLSFFSLTAPPPPRRKAPVLESKEQSFANGSTFPGLCSGHLQR